MFNSILKLLFLTSIHNVKAANILAVFPMPSGNLPNVIITLIQELAEHGHEITLVAGNSAFTNLQATEKITAVDLHNKMSRTWQKYNTFIASDFNCDIVSEVSLTLEAVNNLFEDLLKYAEIQKLIAEKQSYFNLLLLEASMTSLLSLSYVFKAPVILVSTTDAVMGNYEIVGTPIHPFLYPSILQRRIYNLTSWEKLKVISTRITLDLKIRSNEKQIDLMLKRHFGSNVPAVDKLKNNVFALFLNNDPIWAGNRPVPPNVVYIGGIQTIINEELSQDVQSFLDKSRNGVIYVSFGSNVKPSMLHPKKLLRILNVLSHIPYDVLMKWDDDKLPGAPENIKIYKWLPQSSLLAHPKIKLFITQGGIQSTLESINAGVPLIGIPIYSDQWYNTEKYIHFHIGLQVDLATLTEERLIDAIYLVISDESFRSSVKELRALMYDQPGSSLQRAIWWTEQMLRPYRLRYLRAPAANISWAEYLEIEFVLSLLLVLSVIILVVWVLISLIISFIFKSFSDIKKKMS